MPPGIGNAPGSSASPEHRISPQTVNRRDLGWTIVASVALLLAAIVAFWNWRLVSQTNAEAVQLRSSLGTLRRVLLSLVDAETGQRGFLLTGRPEYLDPYLKASAAIEGELAQLNARWPIRNDHNELAQLTRIVRSKMAELKATVDAERSGGNEEALAIVRTHRGKIYMDQARSLAATLEKEINANVVEKSSAVGNRALNAGLISIGTSLILFLLLMMANIHLRKEREMAQAASRAKSEFLASMSHELRTPLNAIIGYSEMLAEEAADAGQTPFIADLGKIQTAGRHLLMLINSVLDLSKIEAGRMDLYLETTSVHALVDEVVSVIQPLADKTRNKLVVNIAPDVGSMHTDQTKVRQTLYNLLSNASKFTQNGKIELHVQRETTVDGVDFVLFVIADTGVGMSPEQIQKIFEPFTQADASTSRRFGGTGLGLTLSRRFAQMLGGEITVESQLNFGSTFTIRLPANVTSVGAPDRIPSVPASRSASDVVLAIDDEPSVHDLLTRTLQKHGFNVASARNGEEGLRLARKLRPIAITLDVMMPGMDGWAVLSALKSDPQLCDIPVLMMTIVDTENIGFALGATDYLTKPIDRERLISVLANYRGSRSSQHALVVEDDEDSRLMMRRALEAEGWKVEDAENGRLALECIEQRRPGIILLDLMMPEMDGFEFLEQLRRRPDSKTIPVIVITARDLTPEDRIRLNGHVSRILMKGSFRIEDLLADVSQLVLTRVRAQPPADPITPAIT